MKPASLQQEILLVTTTKISRRQLAGNNKSCNHNKLSDTEQLEEACWHGFLDKLLPGTIGKPSSGKKLHLWQIRPGSSLLRIELCTFPVVIERYYSIDPYIFLPMLCKS